jgi:predicted RNA binding protein YcfA (HicA-like mRNA interferase family)
MKRKDLIRKITSVGCALVRHGGRHDLYRNPKTGRKQPVLRHDEIDENLAKHITKHIIKELA